MLTLVLLCAMTGSAAQPPNATKPAERSWTFNEPRHEYDAGTDWFDAEEWGNAQYRTEQ